MLPHRRARRNIEEYDLPSGMCSDCKQPCVAVVRDFGIGRNEFWGSVSVHRDERQVSPCCDAEVVEEIKEEEDE